MIHPTSTKYKRAELPKGRRGNHPHHHDGEWGESLGLAVQVQGRVLSSPNPTANLVSVPVREHDPFGTLFCGGNN